MHKVIKSKSYGTEYSVREGSHVPLPSRENSEGCSMLWRMPQFILVSLGAVLRSKVQRLDSNIVPAVPASMTLILLVRYYDQYSMRFPLSYYREAKSQRDTQQHHEQSAALLTGGSTLTAQYVALQVVAATLPPSRSTPSRHLMSPP